jgi:predicted RNA polymerase sigma factor
MKLDELYDRYGERMCRYLALRLGSPEDAEDVLQEAFCRLARYSARWALVRNPKAFVFRVLRNEANRCLARVGIEEVAGAFLPVPGGGNGNGRLHVLRHKGKFPCIISREERAR